MSNRKASLYALMLIALTACTKENTSMSEAAAASTNNSMQWKWHPPNPQPFPNPDPQPGLETTFGLLDADANSTQTQADMNEAGINLARMSIFLSEQTVNKSIDNFLDDGYDVQINANWNEAENGTRGFPTDLDLLQSQAEAFFQYYAPYKDQIPFVAVENEWDWEVVHGANLQDYLTELSIVTSIGHKYGFKVTDGAITSTALQRWMYSQLSGDEQEQWKEDYYVGVKNDSYNQILNIVNTFIAGVKDIDIDYCNVHWYNASQCSNGFATATQTYMQACNKSQVVCNEFGIKTNSQDLFNATVNEITGYTKYAVVYSGGNGDKAIKLTDNMLHAL